ncbi:hypothetical protein HZP56_10970 [Elizabethkingia anophelis]|nr:hypothetical protein [Elizabethkingia anophelis]MCT4177354.1 hypothetical protein [Elizabethkingia anophelis]
MKIIKNILYAATISAFLFPLYSCVAQQAPQEMGMLKQSSVFADFTQLGYDKSEFINRFGQPATRDITTDNNQKVEQLYYIELLPNDILITTKARFVGDKLTDLTNQKIEKSYDQRLKKLEEAVNSASLSSFMSGMKKH